MDNSFSAGFAHLLLTGASGHAIRHISYVESPFAFSAACLLFGHGMLGCLVKTRIWIENPDHLTVVYNWNRLAVRSLAVPIINAQLASGFNNSQVLIGSYLASGLAPLIYRILGGSLFRTERILDVVTLGNVSALGYAGVEKENSLALCLSIWTLYIRFLPTLFEDTFNRYFPSAETYGMALMGIILRHMFCS